MRRSMWSSYLIELSPEKMVEVFSERGWKYPELSDEHGWMLLKRGPAEREGGKFRKFASGMARAFNLMYAVLMRYVFPPISRRFQKKLEKPPPHVLI